MESKISSMLLQLFKEFFRGNEEKYGTHTYDSEEKIVEGKKEEGKWSGWAKDQYANFIKPTSTTYQSHLEGKKAMGVCPIGSDNKVKFAVLDYDPYDKYDKNGNKKKSTYDLKLIKNKVNYIYGNNLPLLCFRSKSGGLHLYIFFKETIQAKEARKIMKKFISLLGLPLKTEIFPKQDRLKDEDSGNWINLPYFNYENPRAYLFGNDCNQIGLYEALNIVKNKEQTVESINDFFSSLDYSDAPPCLQSLALRGGVTECRNIYLTNFAVYFKSKYGKDSEEFLSQLLQTNEDLPDPLPVREITAMHNSYKNNSYSYKCKEEPLCSNCDKKECGLREFGIGQGWVANLDYGDLVQYNSEDSAYYEWTINGKVLTFKNEAEIIEQKEFIRQCMRKLHKLPIQLKKETWTKIVNEALDNIKVENIDEKDDISPVAMLTVYLKEFLIGRTQAQNPSQVLIGKVWYSESHKAYMFRKEALVRFLENKKFNIPPSEITRKIKNLGKGKNIPEVIGVGKGKTTRVKSIPDDFITEEDTLILEDKDVAMDFSKYNKQPF